MAKNKSVNLLPAFFRTAKNTKFLSSTIDQLISTPVLSRINAFVGSKDTPNYKITDEYLQDADPFRQNYQLEPALVVKTLTQEIKKAFAIDDLMNQIESLGGSASNLDRLFDPKFYSYDPKIDWDKLVNYREYYWLPSGPPTIIITGNEFTPIVEINVTDAEDGIQFLFDRLTPTEELFLYKGTTYVFNIKTTSKFYIKYSEEPGESNQYTTGITNNGTNNGQIIFTVDGTTPSRLFYVSENDRLSGGTIYVRFPEDNSAIDVENEIIGKESFTIKNGIPLINGMKIKFGGTVFPETYRDVEFIVEGVGQSIRLIPFTVLDSPDTIAEEFNVAFDGTNFDIFPFDNYKNIPLIPEYVTINRASKDLNPWSRYNRWFHSDVIRIVAELNGQVPNYPANYRASRPIVEFLPDIQLYNFGTVGIPAIMLVDNVTLNPFVSIEGEAGYSIDGIPLEEGFRIIFNADQDPLNKGKIFKATFVNVGKPDLRISLVAEADIVSSGSNVLVGKGKMHGGSSWYYKNLEEGWVKGQQRSSRNQAPLFDLFDSSGTSYGGSDYTSTFTGNKIFGYGIGTGTNDKILGFPLLYKNVGVEGTFVFKNYFGIEDILVVLQDETKFIPSESTYFRVNKETPQYLNCWVEGVDYTIPNVNGIYEVPINLTNNPLNDAPQEFTLTELSDHLKSMAARAPEFVGEVLGPNNIKSIPDIAKYGTRIIGNINPIVFAQHFITDKEHNVVSAIKLVGEQYQQFKFNLIKSLKEVDERKDPSDALDYILTNINIDKTTTFPYYNSDMLAYGTGPISREYRVTDPRNTSYPLIAQFTLDKLSNRSVLIYLNNQQLLAESDYSFSLTNDYVDILVTLERGDVIVINDYSTTSGSFIPPTPSKLGLYPKFEPKIYLDDTYAVAPVNVIQGHDGSLTAAFNDYRDAILLEFEKRIFNNIKVSYRQELFDINTVLPSAYRTQEYSFNEIHSTVFREFLKWKNNFGAEYEKNLAFNVDNHRTYNYSTIVGPTGENLPGNWRAIFKLYFDTDRPHTHPWEMLGFSIKPTWWDAEYGVAPYTSGNTLLWNDLESGKIAQGPRQGIDVRYKRPGLKNIIPVNVAGELLDVRFWGILKENNSIDQVDQNWVFGDMGPAETTWRRSSFWPYAVQIIMAVTKPATYSSVMFDTSRYVRNTVNNLVYLEDNLFISPSRIKLPYETINGASVLASGYSVLVVEAGLQKSLDYLTKLRLDLDNSSINLMSKLGGFVSKDKLEVIVDSVSPNTVSPGVVLPSEDYSIHYNVSSNVNTVSISGIIVQKSGSEFIVRGYDKINPYFELYKPIHQKNDSILTVGGKTEEFLSWSINSFYATGQIVLHENVFYRVALSHNSGTSFASTNYRQLPSLPTVGGIRAIIPREYEQEVTKVSYGTTLYSIQDVCDFILGYGKFLEVQGFVFEDYNTDLGQILNWKLSVREFLYWATQGWNTGSLIALSPFANKIKFQFKDSVVDNIFNSFYDYSLLGATAHPFPTTAFDLAREENFCTITTKDDRQGIYFARLNLVQKEHVLILNNKTRFNDTIYDLPSGYRQRRVKLIGFKTAEWNGDFYSPGFIYDSASIQSWSPYTDYKTGDIVQFTGNYYTLDNNLQGKENFDLNDWVKLGKKPVAQLIPNFDYKISQFEDFYSLDIDNFDVSQQTLAQHLIGYSPRPYLNNIFIDPIAQYKFYQGFIKEKGTKNALDKLAKASVNTLQGRLSYNEEWAFRVGSFGAYSAIEELEFPLDEQKFVDNQQLIRFVNEKPIIDFDPLLYVTPSELSIKPAEYDPATTFKIFQATYDDTPFVLPVAGYPRIDDVTHTVKDRDQLLSLANAGDIRTGDTLWMAFDKNGDWGVYRYARLSPIVTSVDIETAGETIKFITNNYHSLKVGDIFAITNFSSELNGVYVVYAVPQLNEIVVQSTIIIPASTSTAGLLFKFLTARFEKFDDLANAELLADIQIGQKLWIDKNSNNNWEVYEKINNYRTVRFTNNVYNEGQNYGSKIVSREDSNLVLVSAPDYDDQTAGTGRVYVYSNIDNTVKQLFTYGVNKLVNQLYTSIDKPSASFGHALALDSANQILFASAPYASNIRADSSGDTRFVSTFNAPNPYDQEGLVVISKLNQLATAETRYKVLACQDPQEGLNFGSSIFVSNTATSKLLLVGAPGHNTSTGRVFSYTIETATFDPPTTYYDSGLTSFDSATCLFDSSIVFITEVTTTATTQSYLPMPPGITTGSRFGEKITGDLLGKKIAVSAPSFDSNGGAVFVYQSTSTSVNSSTSYSYVQTIKWDDTELNPVIKLDSSFGTDINIDDSGHWLFISAYTATDPVLQTGKVIVYRWNGTEYGFTQILDNPSSTQGLQFGFSIESDATGQTLAVTSQGPNYFKGVSVDGNNTTFDADRTRFGTMIIDAGSAYLYNRYNNKFIYSAELFDETITPNSNYGGSVSVGRNTVYVGAPTFITNNISKNGKVYAWNAIDPAKNSWYLLREQTELVDINTIRSLQTVDTFNQTVQDYIEIYDPLKGKLPASVESELSFRTLFDPAIYTISNQTSVIVDNDTAWGKDHVGELWWDLSNMKYTWYEQGELEFRKNSWGTLFPGCTIDVYEWVASEYLPSEWAALADTNDGLSKGISGQPKHIDNSIISVEESYNAQSDVTKNIYYFWVKNKTIVPNAKDRTTSAYDVAQLILSPKSYGLKYAQLLSANSLSLSNVKGFLINERISLNIQIDASEEKINKHTDWVLIEEGSTKGIPSAYLERKLIDSLLGRDTIGNIVPDLTLSERLKYGIQIRPRQSMFKDRLEALRNLIVYVNSIFTENLITDYYNLNYFLSKDEIPSIETRLYDKIVESLDERSLILTKDLIQAQLTCELSNGRIKNVFIQNPGFGYGKLEVLATNNIGEAISWKGPMAEVYNDTGGAVIETVINSAGQIISVNLVDGGNNYTSIPEIVVRPYTVIVQVDSSSKNKWTRYSLINQKWVKVQTQNFDTTRYWDYTDWVSTEFNPYQTIVSAIDQTYQLAELVLSPNDYIKVNNNGSGRYIILRKTQDNVPGTYNTNFDVMYAEKGTIQIKDSIWDISNSQFGFDQISPYDETFYDQTPDIELEQIIHGLKNNIFVGNLKVYWNKFFFVAVKYALSEQKFLDWAFKTSFINVKNLAGPLVQRSVYKFQDSTWYEQYLNEIKPFHTKVRNYELTYEVVEPTATFTTDFDLPAVYDTPTDKYRTLSVGDPLLDQYPYKGWADNFKMSLESIIITNGGSNYVTVPEVHIIPAQGDTPTRTATAEVLIAGGAVVSCEVIDAGAGYTKTPSIIIIGGGTLEGSVTATAYAKMSNSNVRKNKVSLRFDRISTQKEIGNQIAIDTFTANGNQIAFVLTWPGLLDKSRIVLTVGGLLVLSASYTFEDFIENTNGYSKRFTRLILATAPDIGTPVRIEYPKSLSIYSAFDRIQDYYNPKSGMPGKESAQLMKGIDYPGTELITSGFTEDYAWDVLPYGQGLYDQITSQLETIDTVYDGGNLTTGTNRVFATARGINPEDLILDGDTFISESRSHAPEELIPGEVTDTLGISVYTRNAQGSPMIYTTSFTIGNDVDPTRVKLSITPPSRESVMVTIDNIIQVYGSDYTIDFSTSELVIETRPVGGFVEVTYMDIGGTGFLSMDSVTVEGDDKGSLIGSCYGKDVKSVFVTIDGVRVDPYPVRDAPGWVLETESSDTSDVASGRAKITVYNLDRNSHTITAAFFNSTFKGFSEVREQIELGVEPGNRIIYLNQPPGDIGPASANSIVELNRRRLVPPNTTYYEIVNNQTTFKISPTISYPAGSFGDTSIEVYKNGERLPLNDFYFNPDDRALNQIRFPSGYLVTGDLLAIAVMIDYDYAIRGNQLQFANHVVLEPLPNYVRIITFTNHDASLIRTEVFDSNSGRIYKISRKVINDNFVWVSVGGKVLTSGYDFRILDDFQTIQIEADWPYNPDEKVVIMSLSENTAQKTVGYKVYKDTLGRSQIKRLSRQETTYLSQPLQLPDTSIHVLDGDILPVPGGDVPGIVYIAGERIEYLEKNGNILSKLSRATQGTGARDWYGVGTWVMDQGVTQTVEQIKDTLQIQTFTCTNTTTYSVTGISFIDDIAYHNQVEVYYGGKLLEKPTAVGVIRYKHDKTQSYDSGGPGTEVLQPEFTINGNIPTIVVVTQTVLGGTPTEGSGFVFAETTATMQIQPGWIMQDDTGARYTVDSSGHNNLFNGWGVGFATALTIAWPLTFIEPILQQLTLSFLPRTNVELTVIKRMSTTILPTTTRPDSDSILSNFRDVTSTPQITFIQARDAVPPDQNYYGGDGILRFDDGLPLELDDGNDIEGF